MSYANFAALLAAGELPGRDFRIRMNYLATPVAVVAIHGGGIETVTSDVAEQIAAMTWSSYRFEGIKRSGNSVLHIESEDFDEPLLLWLLKQTQRVVTIHGTAGTTEETFVGGLDTLVRDRVIASLNTEGFFASIATGDIAGTDPANVTNRGTTGAGVQLELTTELRNKFVSTNTAAGRRVTRTPLFYAYTNAVARAIDVQNIDQG